MLNVRVMIRGELAIGRIFSPQTSHEGGTVKGRHLPTRVPVVESVARARLLAAALMPAEPHIRSPFTERLAPQSLILEVIGLGRVGPHCMSAYRSHCLRRSARPDPTRLIRPRGTRDNDSAFADASDWLRDSTRRDLAMGDISPEGDEQFAGERYD